MKKKRIMALFLSAAMTASMLMGCGGSTTETSEGTKEETTEEAGDASGETADNGEVYNINMQIPTWGNAPTEIADVEAAINKITEPEIGVTVTLNPIAAWEIINESNMSITSGEKVDLMCVFTFGQAMDSLVNYTSKNMVNPLNDLYDQYGTAIGDVLEEEISLGYIGDTLYAIPCKSNIGMGAGFTARKDYLDELNIHPDPDKLYTAEELGELFQAYVDKYGQGHYPISLYGAGTDIYQYLNPIETLGGTGNTGVLMGGGLDGNTTVVDLFETDEYMDYCKTVNGWFNAGYINPDVNTISDDVTSQMKSGNYLGSFNTIYPGSTVGLENNIGVELEIFNTVDAYASTTAASQALWTIPTTCENPEKTMQFLNLLYEDRDLANDVDSLLSVGVSGTSYDVVEEIEGSKAIVSPGSGDYTNLVPDLLFGNYFTTPKVTPNEATIYDELITFNEDILKNNRITDAFGYVFDTTAVSTQAAAVTSVNSQYRGLVGYGAADPEEVLPEYIAALKDAGIDDIIAENQKQLDAWYAAKK